MVVEAACLSSGVGGRLLTPLYIFLKLFEMCVYIPSYPVILQVKDFQAFQFLLTEHGFERLYYFIFCA